MSGNAKLIAVGYGGVGPVDLTWSEWHKMRVVFHDFASMQEKHEEFIDSSTMECHGYEWCLCLYPRGDKKSNKDTEHVSLYLYNESASISPENPITATFILRVPSADYSASSNTYTFKKLDGFGNRDFVRRSLVLDPSRRFLGTSQDLKVLMDCPVAVYRDNNGIRRFLSNKDVELVLQAAAKAVHNVTEQQALVPWTCHSIRVGTCICL